RRFLQELAAALPGSPVSRIENPIAFCGKKLHQRLLARKSRHAVAQDNDLLLLPWPRGREKFRNDLFLEPRPESPAHFPSIASHTFLVSTFWVYFTIFPSLKFHMWAKTASIAPPDFLYVPRFLPVTMMVSPAS